MHAPLHVTPRPGILQAAEQRYNVQGEMKPVPRFNISREQHGRMLRMIERGANVTLRLHLDVAFNTDPENHVNLFAEIPGTHPKLKDQLVFVGGHLDSNQGGTGAADNGAGSATNMEAVRILKALNLKPRRTIRLVLWGDEEQGLKGSLGYIRKYVGECYGAVAHQSPYSRRE